MRADGEVPTLEGSLEAVVTGEGMVTGKRVMGTVSECLIRLLGEDGGESPGVPESGLITVGGEVVRLSGDDVPDSWRSETGVFREDGENVKISADEEDITESWLCFSTALFDSVWKLIVPVIGSPRKESLLPVRFRAALIKDSLGFLLDSSLLSDV